MTRIQIRRDTSSNWATYNPVLADGEFALETDTRKLKIGNGEQPYNELAYQEGETYTLPVATADTLGGVKANPTTDEDTQAVNIDPATGLLYTKAGGGVTDAYTKAETDNLLDAKQDTLTPLLPITIQNKIVSNLVGMEFTQDGSGVFGEYSTNISATDMKGRYNYGDNNNDFGDSWTATSIKSYIDIPYTFGQIVKKPNASFGYTNNFIFGKILPSGVFIPIIQHSPSDVLTNDYPKTFSNNRVTWTDVRASSTSISPTDIQDAQIGCSYFQFIDKGSTIEFYRATSDNDTTAPNECYGYIITTLLDRIREINTVRVVPLRTSTGGFGITSSPYPVDRFGLYNSEVSLQSADFANLGDNLFNLSGQVVRNYLEVQVDGTTITTNSNGQLQANIPSNLTTQGNTFNGINQLVQLDSSGKLPAIDGSQLTNLPGGNLKYWTGTETDYTGLATKNADTLYRTTDTNTVYLGTIQLSN